MSRERLEHFRLRSMDQGQLTGAAIAVNAVSDSLLMQHIGVGCKHKTTSQLSTHDTGRRLAGNTGWTEVGDRELIEGASVRLGPYTRSWVERRDPGIVYVASVTFIELTGEDDKQAIADLDAALPIPVLKLDLPGYEGDVFSGYAHTLRRTLERLAWSGAPGSRDRVGVVGYLFDRHEGDHRGNLAELTRLVKAVGGTLGGVGFDGGAFGDLDALTGCGTLLAWPYLGDEREAVTRLTGRTLTPVPFPMGLGATDAFLRRVAEAAGLDLAAAERTLRALRAQAEGQLQVARNQLAGQRVAVFAEPPLAAGWVGLLQELGMQPVLVGLKGHTLGREEAFEAALRQAGHAVPRGLTVVSEPSLARVREEVSARLAAGRLDGVVGSATDHNTLTSLPPERFLGAWAGRRPQGAGPFLLESGFPCKRYHCTRDMPFLGYEGVVVQAQRLLDAPRAWDSGRVKPRM